jgi:hypothetical protein
MRLAYPFKGLDACLDTVEVTKIEAYDRVPKFFEVFLEKPVSFAAYEGSNTMISTNSVFVDRNHWVIWQFGAESTTRRRVGRASIALPLLLSAVGASSKRKLKVTATLLQGLSEHIQARNMEGLLMTAEFALFETFES